MAKEPINWNKAAVAKLGEYSAVGGFMGAIPGFTEPGPAAAAIGIGAALGAGAGVVASIRAKHAANKAQQAEKLGRQFRK